MAKYRKKSIDVEAIQWDGLSGKANSLLGENYGTDWEYVLQSSAVVIPTLEGKRIAHEGDWIIKDVQGFYPCKPGVFEADYEPV